VLEILAVCCSNSERFAFLVLDGIRQQAQHDMALPFSAISKAMLQDVEIKASVLIFINALIMGSSEKDRFRLRNYLRSELFDDNVEYAMKILNEELLQLQNIEHVNTAQSKLKRKSMISVFGPRAYDKRKVEKMIESSTLQSFVSQETGSILGSPMELKSNNLAVYVNPLEGTMAGLLYSAKNADKMEAKLLDFVGGKKTKRR
jgi:hypothetical protein